MTYEVRGTRYETLMVDRIHHVIDLRGSVLQVGLILPGHIGGALVGSTSKQKCCDHCRLGCTKL